MFGLLAAMVFSLAIRTQLWTIRRMFPNAVIAAFEANPQLLPQIAAIAEASGTEPARLNPSTFYTLVVDSSTTRILLGQVRPKTILSVHSAHLVEVHAVRARQGLWKLSSLLLRFDLGGRQLDATFMLVSPFVLLPVVIGGRRLASIAREIGDAVGVTGKKAFG
jgi:hypothetical protein